MDLFEDLFTHPAIAAFLGALFAFLLVVLIDQRRMRIRRKQLFQEIESTHDLTDNKIETLARMLVKLESGRFSPGPVMRFPVERVRRLEIDALDHLTRVERSALAGLCYTMQAIDDEFEEQRQNVLQAAREGGNALTTAAQKLKDECPTSSRIFIATKTWPVGS